MTDSKHLARASILVVAAGFIAKLLGMLRESAASAIFGATRQTDGFALARTLPDMVSTWIEMPVRSAFIPLFTKRRHEQGEEAAWRAASNIINCLVVMLVVLVVVLFLGAGWFVRAISPGFDNEAVWNESTKLARISVCSVVFSVLAVILGALLNIYRRQGLTSLGQIANGGAVLVSVLWLGPLIGLEGYAWGILVGAVATCLLQLAVIWHHRQFYRFTIDPRAPEVRELIVLALPLFIGLTGTRIDVLIDRVFTSYLPDGHFTVLLLSVAIASVAADLVLTVAQSVLLPHFSDLAAQDKYDELKYRLAQSIEGYLLLMTPVAALLCGAAGVVVQLLYQRGNFSAENAELAAVLLPILALQAPAHGAAQIVAQALISNGDTRTPMRVGFWRIGFKLVLSVTLIPLLGIVGLAIASSASAWFRLVLLWWRAPARIRPEGRRILGQAARIIGLGVVGAATAFGLSRLVAPDAGLAIELAAVAGIGLLVLAIGVGGAWGLRVEAAQSIVRVALRRG